MPKIRSYLFHALFVDKVVWGYRCKYKMICFNVLASVTDEITFKSHCYPAMLYRGENSRLELVFFSESRDNEVLHVCSLETLQIWGS